MLMATRMRVKQQLLALEDRRDHHSLHHRGHHQVEVAMDVRPQALATVAAEEVFQMEKQVLKVMILFCPNFRKRVLKQTTSRPESTPRPVVPTLQL
jgi:hypothetical protein